MFDTYVGRHRKPVTHELRKRFVVGATVTAMALGGAALGAGTASAEPIVTVASVTPLQTVDNRHDNDRARGNDHRRGPIVHRPTIRHRGPILRHRGWWENRCKPVRTFDFKHHRMIVRTKCVRVWHR